MTQRLVLASLQPRYGLSIKTMSSVDWVHLSMTWGRWNSTSERQSNWVKQGLGLRMPDLTLLELPSPVTKLASDHVGCGMVGFTHQKWRAHTVEGLWRRFLTSLVDWGIQAGLAGFLALGQKSQGFMAIDSRGYRTTQNRAFSQPPAWSLCDGPGAPPNEFGPAVLRNSTQHFHELAY